MTGVRVPAARAAGFPPGIARLLVVLLAALVLLAPGLARDAADPLGRAGDPGVSVAADCSGHGDRCLARALPAAVGAPRAGFPEVPPMTPAAAAPAAPAPATAAGPPSAARSGAPLLVVIGVSRR